MDATLQIAAEGFIGRRCVSRHRLIGFHHFGGRQITTFPDTNLNEQRSESDDFAVRLHNHQWLHAAVTAGPSDALIGLVKNFSIDFFFANAGRSVMVGKIPIYGRCLILKVFRYEIRKEDLPIYLSSIFGDASTFLLRNIRFFVASRVFRSVEQ